MVAGLSVGRQRYAAVEPEMEAAVVQAATLVDALSALVARDAEAYARVGAAYRLPKEPADAAATRAAAVTAALLGAAEVPLETARLAADVAELAAGVAERGNRNAVGDAGVAALLAEAACRGAAYNVRINVAALEDRAPGLRLAERAQAHVGRAADASARAQAAVERAL
jgi:glutamate formiminotransferase/formiminotetrahydrofolate cyclodeaminase